MPAGFPSAQIGHAAIVGIDDAFCTDRYNRYGPFGYGQISSEHVRDWQRPVSRPEWSSVDWKQLQDDCFNNNQNRFQTGSSQSEERVKRQLSAQLSKPDSSPAKVRDTLSDNQTTREQLTVISPQRYHPRTALLVRTWEGYTYTEDDLLNLRALNTELSLMSGGEYQTYLLVQVTEEDDNIWDDHRHYADAVKRIVPREFRDISILWSEALIQARYPKVGNWQAQWHRYMPVQWFSEKHPEFDFVWNWEINARYTGNHYQFLEALAEYSRKVPRKYMWEKNQRFYIPAAHGRYAEWLRDTVDTIERAVKQDGLRPVWGARPYKGTESDSIQPPSSIELDGFRWGVGEDADLITLQPIFDPNQTEWRHRSKIWNFVSGVSPTFSASYPGEGDCRHPGCADVPRRASIGSMIRLSKRQLHAMHLENLAGRAMHTDMWPATVALHHGLKAVYAPHPVWVDRKWPSWYMDAVFNADGGELAQWGQRNDSVYNHDREYNFAGLSYSTASEFPNTLYRRWLGWKSRDSSFLSDMGGGDYEEHWNLMSLGEHGSDSREKKVSTRVGGNGRMCLPPMLLHPVRKMVETENEL